MSVPHFLSGNRAVKYLFLSIFVLCLGLVGCNKGLGPDTGWECPACHWGCDQNATECLQSSDKNKSVSERQCYGYSCQSCKKPMLSVHGFTDEDSEESLRGRRIQRQECHACDAAKHIDLVNFQSIKNLGSGGHMEYVDYWILHSKGYLRPWKPVKR